MLNIKGGIKMVKQTAGNNAFLKEAKRQYNEPIFKKFSKLVNDGKQELAEYMDEVGLIGFSSSEGMSDEEASQILMDNNIKGRANSPEKLSELFDKAKELKG